MVFSNICLFYTKICSSLISTKKNAACRSLRQTAFFFYPQSLFILAHHCQPVPTYRSEYKFDGRVLYPHSWSKGFYDALDKQIFHSSSGNFTIPKLLLEFIFSFSVTGYWFNNICLHQIGKMFWSTWWSLFSSDYYRL